MFGANLISHTTHVFLKDQTTYYICIYHKKIAKGPKNIVDCSHGYILQSSTRLGNHKNVVDPCLLKIIVDLHARASASYWSCKPGELGYPF